MATQRASKRLNPILAGLAIGLVVAATVAPAPVARAELDRAQREAIAAAAVKLAALVTVREGRAATEELWPLGSATIVSPEGVLLTNNHVLDLSGMKARLAQEEAAATRQGRERRLTVLDGRFVVLVTEGAELRRAYIADAQVSDPVLDLAVLQITAGAHGEPLRGPLQLPYVPLGDSDTLLIGDPIHVFGYPATAGGTLKYTQGRVSGFATEPGILGWAWIDSDATVSGGSSGGTAVNDAGELIGVPTLATELDCRPGDTNGDGVIDEGDIGCIPIGDSFLRMRPINLAKPLLLQVSPFFEATPIPATTPSPTATLEPSPTPETTPTAEGSPSGGDSDAAAVFAAWREAARRRPSLTGPLRGVMRHQEGRVATIHAGVSVQDFYVRAEFTPPTGEAVSVWDAGFLIRHTAPEEHFRWFIRSDGRWVLMNGTETVDSGGVPDGLIPPRSPVTLELAAVGDRIYFAVNDAYVGSADISARMTAGDVLIGAALMFDTTYIGEETAYQGFEVWSLDPAEPAVTPTPNPDLLTGPALLHDDFTDPAAGVLPVESRNPRRYRTGYEGGEYVVEALVGDISEEFPIWFGDTFSDGAIEVDVRFTMATDAAYVFVACRGSQNPRREYHLVVDPVAGYAWLSRGDGSMREDLAPPQPFDAIRQGHGTNRLFLSCTGSTITAAINGDVLASVEDSTYGQGQFAIGSGIYAGRTGRYELRFDNLVILDTAGPATATPTPTASPTLTPTLAPTPTFTPEPPTPEPPTPTPAPLTILTDAELLATWKRQAREQESLTGSLKGKLEQQEGSITFAYADVQERDFYVRVRFTNPRDASEAPWDYGVGFRDDGNGSLYVLAVTSDGTYHLFLKEEMWETVAEGVATGLLVGASERNEIGIVVAGDTGYFEINGQYVATLDLSGWLRAGRVWAGTGVFTDTIVPGDRVAYDRFDVWTLPYVQLRTLARLQPSLAGPFSGTIEQRLGELDGFFAGVFVRDFYLRAEFTNPSDASEQPWDAGVAFRHTGPNEQTRLIITSDGLWFLTDGADSPYAGGIVSGLRTGAGETNAIEVFASGDVGYLIVNGRSVTPLDLSISDVAGEIWLGSGFFPEYVDVGAITEFSEFEVWSLDG